MQKRESNMEEKKWKKREEKKKKRKKRGKGRDYGVQRSRRHKHMHK